MPTSPALRARTGELWHRWGGKVLRYATGSVVAAICSETAFVIMYGAVGATTTWATVIGWLAGALPNYWLNRSWTWRLRGRPRFVDEVLPYVAIILVTLVTAVVATNQVDRWLAGSSLGHPVKVALVSATFLAVYGVMFLLRFFLLDRLFARVGHHTADAAEPTDEHTPIQDEDAAMTADEGSGAFQLATGRDLEDSSGANQANYRAYQYELISEHCGPTVLEVGAGLGEFASQFTGLRRHVVTDVDPEAVRLMAQRFSDRPEVEARQLDLAHGPYDVQPSVSTVVAINVLEHIEADSDALRSLAGIVEPGGRIVLWVPGYQQLYGDFDRRVGHVRRYTPTTLRAAIVGAGLRPGAVRPVNLLGGMAWWLAVKRGGVGSPKPGLLRVYDKVVVPTTRFVERRVTPPFGQSVLGVAHVPAS